MPQNTHPVKFYGSRSRTVIIGYIIGYIGLYRGYKGIMEGIRGYVGIMETTMVTIMSSCNQFVMVVVS